MLLKLRFVFKHFLKFILRGLQNSFITEFMSLKGSLVVLRAVEKDDASTIFMWENNPDNWKVSNTEVPFSLFDIHQLIEHQSDIPIVTVVVSINFTVVVQFFALCNPQNELTEM